MIDSHKRVFVYWNLHKKCWSVRQSGIVVKHTDDISLKDCRFLVGVSGLERVREEKRKNVHAGVSEYVIREIDIPYGQSGSECEVIYNPYKYETFVDYYDHEPILHSDFATLDNGPDGKSVYALWITPPVEEYA